MVRDAVEVVTFDYPCELIPISLAHHLARSNSSARTELFSTNVVADMAGGKRRAPPKAEKLVDHHLGVVKDAVAKHQGRPLVLMGKSMGSR
jgi:predicted alpha/beta-hydrolase family hydrolase